VSKAPWTDIISDFVDHTARGASPDIFRLWAAISLVGGALERRVWIRSPYGYTFPNLYVMLVAPPGVGKLVIDQVQDLWQDTLKKDIPVPAFKVAPSSVSKASLMDRLSKAGQSMPLDCPTQMTYHSLLVAAEEMGVLMPGYDMEFIGVLNKIFNNGRVYDEERRTSSVKSLKIDHPQLNLLLGAQPGWLGQIFPEEAWTSGLTSRMILVYASEGIRRSYLGKITSLETERKHLLGQLSHVSGIWGEVDFEEGVFERFDDWQMGMRSPLPSHSKLAHYCTRRPLHLLKLCIISAVSRTGKKSISAYDLDRAFNWLFSTEKLMPDIFRAMVGRSDNQVIEELHFFLTATWNKGGRQPVPFMALRNFLRERVPSDKIEKILDAALSSGVVAIDGDSQAAIPRPKHEHGME